MDAPNQRRFRFGLRTLLVVTAVFAATCGVLTRRTDPMLVRKGMSPASVWWNCGWPRSRTSTRSMTDWTYSIEPVDQQPTFLTVRFDDMGVTQAHYLKREGAFPTFEDVLDDE
jgi:hypothetical protein